VAFETSPPGSTYIQALDAHFWSTISHHPSSLSSLNRGDVVEIQGPSSSGKTHLVYHLLITCIMPSNYLSVDLGGWDKAAIVFDSDGAFDVCRLRELLLSRLSRLCAKSCECPHIQDLANKALEKLHLFRPATSNQLAVTLLHLPAYHTAHLPETEIGLLAIDSISSFYWPDRLTVELMRSAQPAPSYTSPLQHVLTALQDFRSSHAPVIVLTNWGLNPLTNPSPTSTSTFYRQHLHPFPSPFNGASTDSSMTLNAGSSLNSNLPSLLPIMHHITLLHTPIPPFRSGISLEEAKSQEEMYRKALVDKGEVVGLVRSLGSTRVGRFLLQIGVNDITSGGVGL